LRRNDLVTPVRTLFLSDLHLGAVGSRADLALAFLMSTEAQTYVLVGDILDLWLPGPKQWGPSEMAILDFIKLRHRNGANIVYVLGNHDADPEVVDATGHLPVPVQKRATYRMADGRRFLVVHGDDADNRVFHSPVLTWIGSWLDRQLRSIDHMIGHLVNRPDDNRRTVIESVLSSINWMLYPNRKHEAWLVDQARQGGFDGVICGHFHMAELHDRHGLTYANCGDWIDSYTALAEDNAGNLIRLGGREALAPLVKRRHIAQGQTV